MTPNTAKRTVRMLGHSIHTIDKFMGLVAIADSDTLVDVRSSPASSRHPQFSQKRLEASIKQAGFRYEWRPRLGGRNPLTHDPLRLELEALAAKDNLGRMVLMCSEGDYLECHRHYLLAPVLIEMGWRVEQVLKDGTIIQDRGPNEKTLRKMAAYLPQGEVTAKPQGNLWA